MATKKISELAALTSPDGAEELLINDGGTSKKITITNATASKLPLAGGTMTGDLSLGDNVKAQFGASDDLQIYHSGTHSYIKDAGEGVLYLQGSTWIVLEDTDGNNMVACQDGAAVTLYHNGSTKLATTSTGIDVTGNVTADTLTVEGSNGNFDVASSGNDVTMTRGAANYIYASHSSGELYLGAGGVGTFLKIDNSGDISFYEDTGTTAKMVWDASAESLGIGTSSPARGLQIHKEGNHLSLTTTASGTAGGNGSDFKVDASSSDLQILNYEASNTTLWTNGTERMRIDSSGGVGIGTTSPSAKLHIKTTASSLIGIGIQNSQRYYAIETESGGLRIKDVTAGALERMRIDSSGNVGIGVTPETWTDNVALQIGGTGALGCPSSTSAGQWLEISQNHYYNSGAKRISQDEASSYLQTAGKHIFRVAPSGTADSAISWTTAMTIDGSGNVLVGTTDSQPSGNNVNGIALRADNTLEIAATTTSPVRLNRKGNDGDVINFLRGTTAVGSVSITTTATAYNTSSDYRLKENVVPMTGSIDRLKELNPSRFNFIIDADKTVDGFLAHEAQSVVPEAVSGTKDDMQTEEYTVSEALGEVFTPAVEEVTEERQVTETVETGSYVNLAGETITETQEVGVTEEATETVIERQDIDGVLTEVEVEKVTQEPVMETVVTTEAVAEVILETDVEKPEELTEGQQWRETTAKVTAEREVPDMQGIDQAKLVPLLVGALQEAIARIEVLENPQE